MPTTTRLVLILGLLLVGGVTGCAADVAPAEPFGDLTFGVYGGVAGRQDVLRVRADGTAVALAPKTPVAGRLPAADLARLKTLLTSTELRREAAVARKAGRDRPACTDQFSTSLTMGALYIGRTDPCVGEPRPKTPTYDEISGLLHEPLAGVFAEPLPDTDGSPRRAVRLDRLATADLNGYRIEVASDGTGTMTVGDRVVHRRLDRAQQDALRMALGYLVEQPPEACSEPTRYRLTVPGTAATGAECAFPAARPELRAVTRLLEQVFTG